MNLTNYQTFLAEKQGIQKLKKQELVTIQSTLKDLDRQHQNWTKVRDVLSATGILAQKQVRNIIEELVTLAIQCVFGLEYKFIVEDTVARNHPETNFYIEKNGVRHSLRDEHGGSLAVLSAFALRVIIASITCKNIRKTVILDEPLKDADKGKLEDLGAMIKKLHELLGIQFIIVTHEDQLMAVADRSFIVTQTNDISFVQTVGDDAQ
jgi:DNA repair exonuclease SbcCD ATPase subunit